MNTSKIGSTAIFTYTAEPDGAGNPGPSVTRNVTIVGYELLEITSLTTSSNNSVNSSYAKAGDEITINLRHDGIIQNVTGNILGDDNFTVNKYSGATDLKKIITQNDINGNLTFNIFMVNSSEYAATVTQEDLTSNNIIIDTISPIITLKGINDTVSVLNYPYADANATAYDLSYGSKNIPPVGTVDIATVGNYILSYSAPSDFAGNEAQNITRNVIVRDLPPISLVESFTVLPAGTLVNSTTIDNPDHIATFQIGTATYAGISSSKGLTIINITDIGSPTHVSRYSGKPDGINGFLPAVTAFVSIDGSTYALSEYGVRVAIFKANNLVSFNPIAVIIDGQDDFTELTGPSSIATATIGSSTYALVASGADNGVQIINITTPGSPIAASALSDGPKYTELEGPLSITTTTIGSSTYALVASGPDDGVQIIDITNPYAPTNTSSVEDGSNFPELDYARSITITTIGSSTYALVASETDRGVQIMDITTPSDPKPVSDFDDGDTGFTTLSGAQYITTTTIDSSTYALVAANRDNGVQIIDITDPYHPDPVSAITDGSKYTELEGAESIAIVAGSPPVRTQFTNLAQIPSVIITNVTSSATYRATVTVSSAPIEDYADFVITLENNQSVTLSVTENNFPSNVFIDTIAPTIELVGDSDHTVYVGTQNPIIPGAIVTDNSPGYSALTVRA